jgi:hypothetical protein
MDIHTKAPIFSSLGGLALLAISTAACDVDNPETSTDVDEALALDAEDPGLVSESPDTIDGLGPVGFDEERQVYVYDRDDDGFPDITEDLEGTDMFDPDSNPALDWLAPTAQGGFPAGNCRAGFRPAGSRLCISTHTQNAAKYRYAILNCRNHRSNVCSYADLTYLYVYSALDATYNPSGKWIGDMTGDDQVLCGNRTISYDGDPDWANFEKTCSKTDVRSYWCCHDVE